MEDNSIIETDMDAIEKSIEDTDKAIFFCAGLEGKFIHVKVGDINWDSKTATEEIEKVKNDLQKLLDDNEVNCLLYVTHRFVEIRCI